MGDQPSRPTTTPSPFGAESTRYPLGRLLGRGGMADVYASLDEQTGRRVAVKVFRDPAGEDPHRRSAEVGVLTGLRHPNLVELLDSGSSDGHDFLVMDLVDGVPLSQLCRHNPLSLEETARIGAGVADGLAYVHEHGIVHRDVKPANVLLGPGNRVRLADFGIARLLTATRFTRTGFTVGTAGYLAPEQVTGGPVDTAADLYALGLLLLECLTGELQYAGPPVEAALARLHRTPEIPESVPAGWQVLLARLTATETTTRPNARRTAEALHHLFAAPDSSAAAVAAILGPPARATEPRVPAARPAHRRWRLAAAGGALLAIGLTATATAGTLLNHRATPVQSAAAQDSATPSGAGAPNPAPATLPVADSGSRAGTPRTLALPPAARAATTRTGTSAGATTGASPTHSLPLPVAAATTRATSVPSATSTTRGRGGRENDRRGHTSNNADNSHGDHSSGGSRNSGGSGGSSSSGGSGGSGGSGSSGGGDGSGSGSSGGGHGGGND